MSNLFLSIRPPVTPYEAQKLRSLPQIVQQSDVDMFEVHGYIHANTTQNQTLIYTVDQGGKLGAKVLRPGDTDTKSLGELYESIHQAAPIVGGGTRGEMDPRNLPRDHFSLNFDPLELDNGILSAVSAFCKTGAEAKLYCLSVMAKGGCFETTANADHEARGDYVGSLTIGIPTIYDGGELLLAKDDRKTTIKTGAKAKKEKAPGSFWAFNPHWSRVSSSADYLWYEYPTWDFEYSRAGKLCSILRGSDYLLWHAAGAIDYRRTMTAARKLSVDFDLSDTFWIEGETLKSIRVNGEKVYPVDAFSSHNPDLGIVHLTSHQLKSPLSYAVLSKGTGFELLGEECDAMFEMDLIWTAAPTVWYKDGTVLQDGEEEEEEEEETCSIVQSYVAAVIVLEIPVPSK
ncbi:hypothetical protein FRC04_003174 [Tulasnella sp. 424]|nr:hypothetical protein FRC04_003174 [Tulasnella sp. 424]KAG8966283.1 hypothetical protein FRC05_002742 [Tulasnella sp. 425]